MSAFWSDSFSAEERASLPVGRVTWAVAAVLVVVCLGALIGEVVVSVQTTSRELTSHYGSWVLSLLSLAFGFAGPYATLLTWRSRARSGLVSARRASSTAVVGITVAALAIGWLLFIRTTLHVPIPRF